MNPLKPGDRLGAYVTAEEIGFGGMGVVYRARDERLGREVAIKVLAPWLSADPASHEALLREARLASSLNHPNVCTVHEVGEHDGRIFIVMELVRGETLGSITASGGLPSSRVLRYGLQIADALGEAHGHGVVHRDLKINNVMITETGLVKVLDFGIAVRREPDAPVGDDDASEGTPAYMAPETLDRGRAGVRSDLWSLGVLLYEMCTGERPFHGRDVGELQTSIRHDEPKPLPPRVSPTLRSVIQRCLEKDPVMRYGFASEVRAALETAQHDSTIMAAPRGEVAPPPPPAPAPRRRVPLWAWAGALVVLALTVGLLWRDTGRGPQGRAGTIRSLAVLPLDNLSGDPQQDYFADGMTEELIAALARLTPLQVISRTSIMRYKGTQKTLKQIARELNVDAVVEGSVVRSGNRVRVTAQLIDAGSDGHLWSRSLERDVEDVLTLQSDIARQIVGELHAVLLPANATSRPRRVDPEAYEAILRGRYHVARRSIPDLQKAMEQFEASIAVDPGNADAWAGLAASHALLHGYGVGSGDEQLRLAERAADRAIEIDPASADAQAAHGQVSTSLWQWDHAERSLRRAIELQPNHTDGHYWYAKLLLEQGRREEALAEIDLAVKSDPLSQTCAGARAEILSALDRYDEAHVEIDRVLRLDPSFARIYLERLDLMHIHGQLREAAHAIAQMDSLSGMSAIHARRLIDAFDRDGPKGYWSEASRQLIAGEGGRVAPAWWIAYCLGLAGDTDAAFKWLSRSLDRHEYSGLRWRWAWEPLRGDPRFQTLLRRMDLE
jgi:serine/threonine-protein kinase